MHTRSLVSKAILLSTCSLFGCAAAYMPKPSPRVQVMSEGQKLILVKNGQTYPMGMLGGGLEDAVRGNPRAEEEASSFHTGQVTGFALGITGAVGAGIGAGLLVGNEVGRRDDGLRMAGLGVALGGLGVSLIGTLIAAGSMPRLWNAINIYNDGIAPQQGAGAYPGAYTYPNAAPPPQPGGYAVPYGAPYVPPQPPQPQPPVPGAPPVAPGPAPGQPVQPNVATPKW